MVPNHREKARVRKSRNFGKSLNPVTSHRNLDSDIDNTYQYWVVDLEPLENSPELVKTADPYSHIVLSPFDDPWIPENSYPNLPTYPEGQEREVTLLNLSSNDYNWQVENFEKPKKEDLII